MMKTTNFPQNSVSIIPQEDVENYIEVEPRTGFII